MTEPRRILVVDDEPLARQRVARYLRQFEQELLIREAESGIQAVELIRDFHPEIIFLDVEMPGLNGFEVLLQFEERPFQIIFQTAYDQFAIRAFEEHAFDYLLKPFTAARLHDSLSRALVRVADEERLRSLEARLAEREGDNAFVKKLMIKQGVRLRIIETLKIACFVSRDHYTSVYFDENNTKHEGICDLSLARLTERLDPREFRQLHRNNIARIAAITAFSRSRQGAVWVELTNGMKLPVSRSNRRMMEELVRGRNDLILRR